MCCSNFLKTCSKESELSIFPSHALVRELKLLITVLFFFPTKVFKVITICNQTYPENCTYGLSSFKSFFASFFQLSQSFSILLFNFQALECSTSTGKISYQKHSSKCSIWILHPAQPNNWRIEARPKCYRSVQSFLVSPPFLLSSNIVLKTHMCLLPGVGIRKPKYAKLSHL